ncbi:MAG: ABC transporter ATP-binding protein/permease [Candidatus Bathyarchaeota archaeon]|nr:ABC transporter ATP-binding protein/permease [Candidatus Bathyarchaeum sp.]
MRRRPKGGMQQLSKLNVKALRRILSYITGQYKLQFAVVFMCIVLSSIVSVVGSLFLEVLIDDYISPLLFATNPVFTDLLKAILIMGGIYAVGIVTTVIYNRLMASISQGVLKQIRDEMFSKMQQLPIKYFDTHTHGEVMSHYTNDADALRQMLSQSVPQAFSSFITIVAVFFAMVITSVPLTLVVVFVVLLMLFVTSRIGGKSASFFVSQQKSLGATQGYVEEMINGQKVVKVFCQEESVKAQFDRYNDELFEDATAANTFANIMMPIMANLANLQYVLIAIVGGALAISGGTGLTLGGIVAFLQLSRSLGMPINMLSQQTSAIVMALAGAERIFDLMDQEPETDEGYVTLVNAKLDGDELTESSEYTGNWAWKQPNQDGTYTYTKLTGDVRLYNVDFGYEENKPVLHDVSLFAKPGQKIAFVGATGAGKTTITNLLNRFYDIADGEIVYDGINITKIKKSDLRRSLGMVLQDTNLFTGTVMENIRYGNLDATDEEVYTAAKLANAHEFIQRLPKGYKTLITGNGEQLSQGQKQLISIARVAVANPPVMILDEATASIDTRTEAIVQKGMDSLMHGRTVFVIAHRLSTVHNSEAILVLDNGRIIERGSHKELIALKGKYYQLYTGAFELE